MNRVRIAWKSTETGSMSPIEAIKQADVQMYEEKIASFKESACGCVLIQTPESTLLGR